MPKAVTVKYLPHNGKRGARLQASNCDGNKVQVPYDLPGMDNEPRDVKWRRAMVELYATMDWPHPDRTVMGWTGDLVAVFVDVTTRDVFPFLGDQSLLHPCDGDDLMELRRKGAVRGCHLADLYSAWMTYGTKPADKATIEQMMNDLILAYGGNETELLERLIR